MWLGESDPRGRQVRNEFGEKVRFQIILGSGGLGKAMALLGDRQKDTEGFEQKKDMLQLTFLNDYQGQGSQKKSQVRRLLE